MKIQMTSQFKKDARHTQKRGKDMEKLWAVVKRLLEGRPLASRNRAHRLSGEFSDARECHIEPDWLLIWKQTDDALVLVRTGTHSDLFG